jgi:hypothetical protein
LTRLNKRGLLASDGAGHGVHWWINQTAACIELRAGDPAAHTFSPRHFTGILADMGTHNVMLADLPAAEPVEIAFR